MSGCRRRWRCGRSSGSATRSAAPSLGCWSRTTVRPPLRSSSNGLDDAAASRFESDSAQLRIPRIPGRATSAMRCASQHIEAGLGPGRMCRAERGCFTPFRSHADVVTSLDGARACRPGRRDRSFAWRSGHSFVASTPSRATQTRASRVLVARWPRAGAGYRITQRVVRALTPRSQSQTRRGHRPHRVRSG